MFNSCWEASFLKAVASSFFVLWTLVSSFLTQIILFDIFSKDIFESSRVTSVGTVNASIWYFSKEKPLNLKKKHLKLMICSRKSNKL